MTKLRTGGFQKLQAISCSVFQRDIARRTECPNLRGQQSTRNTRRNMCLKSLSSSNKTKNGNNLSRLANCNSMIAKCNSRIANCNARIASCNTRIASCNSRTTNSKSRKSNSGYRRQQNLQRQLQEAQHQIEQLKVSWDSCLANLKCSSCKRYGGPSAPCNGT